MRQFKRERRQREISYRRGMIANENVQIGLDFGMSQTAIILLKLDIADEKILDTLERHFFLEEGEADKILEKAKTLKDKYPLI